MSTATPACYFHDFIRPGEETLYAQIDAVLLQDLAPEGILEHYLVEEIRRAMWRLRRCARVEESFLESDAVLDPMQLEATAKIQLAVDRARAQAHRIFHKCTAELRKLQTERIYRNETHDAGADISYLGLCDFKKVRDGIAAEIASVARTEQHLAETAVATFMRSTVPPPVGSSCKTDASFCKTEASSSKTEASSCKNAQQSPGPMPKAA